MVPLNVRNVEEILLLSRQLNILLSERGPKTVAVACSFIYVYEIVGGYIHKCRRRIGSDVRPAMVGCTQTVPITRPVSHLRFSRVGVSCLSHTPSPGLTKSVFTLLPLI